MTLDASEKRDYVGEAGRDDDGLDILIVDDESYICELLAELLAERSHRSETAANGLEALEKLSQRRFDVIVSDVKMPRMDGFALLREVKQLYPDSAFVVMTGFSQKYSIKEALEMGAEEYLSKPFNIEEVLNIVERAHQRNKARRQNGQTADIN